MEMPGKPDQSPVRLAERRVFSSSFWPLNEMGMGMIEEVSVYLDGEGRREARRLSATAAALFSAESMRLTTRLMQIASWLLLQRAAHSGEMSRDQVAAEKAKVKLDTQSAAAEAPGWDELPEKFTALVSRSVSLQRQIRLLDADIYGCGGESDGMSVNPVSEQIHLLRTAFSGS